jgi:hypothetical protein
MKNDYEIRGDVTAIIINSPKFGSEEVLISTSKFERANEIDGYWCLGWRKNPQTFYVNAHAPRENGKQQHVFLHRWLTNAPKGTYVDHINHNGLVNTDENLRVVTHAENKQNAKGAHKDSKTGIIGVSWHRASMKWRATIGLNGKQLYLGCFHDINEAEQAVKDAKKKYHPFSQEALA